MHRSSIGKLGSMTRSLARDQWGVWHHPIGHKSVQLMIAEITGMSSEHSDGREHGYPLEHLARPDLPKLPGVVAAPDRGEDVLDLITADLLAQALDCTHRFGGFHLAFSGSEGLEGLCRRMMFDPDLRRFPWDRTHLWISDDRCVPRNDPLSCYGRLRESLIIPAGIPVSQVHPIPATDESADEIMHARLDSELSSRLRGAGQLDCVVLDVDEHGSIGGLFPGEDAVLEKTRHMRFTQSHHPDEEQYCVALTLPIINDARMIQVLVQGQAAGDALRRQVADPKDVIDFPAAGLQESDRMLKWYFDREAASSQG